MSEHLQAVWARARVLRQDIHRHPELGYQEERTAGVVRAALDRLGIAWEPCAGTGTIGRLAVGRGGRHLAFRADLDALPIVEATGLPYASVHHGCMHACGHDGHTATLLAAAELLKQHEAQLPGPVSLIFQPAEEGGHGAKRMVEGGCLTGIDEIYGFHNWPPMPFGRAAVPAGPLLASNAAFFLELHGRGGHASQPEQTIDPVVAAAALVQAAQTLVSRGTAPQEAAVLSITRLRAGEATNVIPDHAELAGTIRAAETAQVRSLYERFVALAGHIAAAHGCRLTERYEPHYPATVNHAGPAARVAAELDGLLPAGWSWTRGIPIMGAEDFSYYLERIPGAYVLLGSGTAGAPCEPCHSPRFDFDDRLTPIAARLWCRLAGLADL